MSFNYDPKDATNCLPAGEYDATLANVEEKRSKAGNPMLELTYAVYGGGREVRIRDYVVNPSGIYRLRNLARALGKEDEFNSGSFDAQNYKDTDVRVELSVEQQEGFDDQNRIKKVLPPTAAKQPVSYRAPKQPAAPNPISQKEEFQPADIPF